MSTQKTVRREAGTVGENPVRLDREKAEQVIEALNTDLAAIYVLYHQLRKHHWNVAGAEFEQLHDWFGDAAEDAEDHADEIASALEAPVSYFFEGLEAAAPETTEAAPVARDLSGDLLSDKEALDLVRARHGELAHV